MHCIRAKSLLEVWQGLDRRPDASATVRTKPYSSSKVARPKADPRSQLTEQSTVASPQAVEPLPQPERSVAVLPGEHVGRDRQIGRVSSPCVTTVLKRVVLWTSPL